MQPHAFAARAVEGVGRASCAQPDEQAAEEEAQKERGDQRQAGQPERLQEDPAEPQLRSRWRIYHANDDWLNRAHVRIVPSAPGR
jgi:hypothetical protein